MKVLSYGGGLDSFALLLKSVQLGEKPDACVFMDVGDGAIDRDGKEPGEWPGTYRHMREVAIPFCETNGIAFVWLSHDKYPVRDANSLFAWLRARNQIPVTGPQRICTTIAKVERFERWLDDQFPGQEVEVWIGFEAGEDARADKDPNAGNQRKVKVGSATRRNRFPLMEWDMCRCRCEEFVREQGFPIPRKSACVFCPYGTLGDWQTFAKELPEDFAKAVALEGDKPLTGPGKKLSIKGYQTLKKVPKKTKLHVMYDSSGVAYVAPTLPEYIQGVYKPEVKICKVCRSVRATKATACDYLEGN